MMVDYTDAAMTNKTNANSCRDCTICYDVIATQYNVSVFRVKR